MTVFHDITLTLLTLTFYLLFFCQDLRDNQVSNLRYNPAFNPALSPVPSHLCNPRNNRVDNHRYNQASNLLRNPAFNLACNHPCSPPASLPCNRQFSPQCNLPTSRPTNQVVRCVTLPLISCLRDFCLYVCFPWSRRAKR